MAPRASEAVRTRAAPEPRGVPATRIPAVRAPARGVSVVRGLPAARALTEPPELPEPRALLATREVSPTRGLEAIPEAPEAAGPEVSEARRVRGARATGVVARGVEVGMRTG